MIIDQAEHPLYQSIAFIIGQPAKGDAATAQMGVIERIAAGAAKWTLPCDLDRERRSSASEDSGPRMHHF
jgi:hypothetical protein